MTQSITWQNQSQSLSHLDDHELLGLRLRDLPVKLAGSSLEKCVDRLYGELEAAGLRSFRPPVYVGDEWFSPQGVPAIAVPFFLLHPRLKRLEQRMMRTVEGGTREWAMRLLRHEAGHCFDHAFQLSRQSKWRQLFGDPNQTYDPDHYSANPQSRDYVTNLEDNYAQSHPDEDFAETFAVYINPGVDWRSSYRRCPTALQKLEYVRHQIYRYANNKPLVPSSPRISDIRRLRTTLRKHYQRRRRSSLH